MQAIFFKVFRWLLATSQIKFVAFTLIFLLFNFFQDIVVGYLNPFASTGGLNSAFTGLSPSLWYFVNVFNLSYGIPLLIGAHVVRFLIRRIPIIG